MKESITITWCWEDIQSFDESLTKEQCCKVLELLEKRHDAGFGINWEIIEYAISDLYNKRQS